MGIAAFTVTSLARPLHKLQRWWQQMHPVYALWRDSAQGAAPADLHAVSVLTLRRAGNPISNVTSSGHCAGSNPQSPVHTAVRASTLPAFRRPNHRNYSRLNGISVYPKVLKFEKPSCPLPRLRVLHRPANLARPGGLVISGRMADVCAELDRLVALEAVH